MNELKKLALEIFEERRAFVEKEEVWSRYWIWKINRNNEKSCWEYLTYF